MVRIQSPALYAMLLLIVLLTLLQCNSYSVAKSLRSRKYSAETLRVLFYEVKVPTLDGYSTI